MKEGLIIGFSIFGGVMLVSAWLLGAAMLIKYLSDMGLL